MGGSFMRLPDVGRYGHQHFFLRKRNLFHGFIWEFKYYLARRNRGRDIFVGPFPLVCDGYGLHRIDILQLLLQQYFVVCKGKT